MAGVAKSEDCEGTLYQRMFDKQRRLFQPTNTAFPDATDAGSRQGRRVGQCVGSSNTKMTVFVPHSCKGAISRLPCYPGSHTSKHEWRLEPPPCAQGTEVALNKSGRVRTSSVFAGINVGHEGMAWRPMSPCNLVAKPRRLRPRVWAVGSPVLSLSKVIPCGMTGTNCGFVHESPVGSDSVFSVQSKERSVGNLPYAKRGRNLLKPATNCRTPRTIAPRR